MLEIDRDAIPRHGLDLAQAPIRLGRVAHTHARFYQGHHQSLSLLITR
jgi:hypothetical protein